MPITDVDVLVSCAECGAEIETVNTKKDNMMLFSKETVWCPQCQADRPQVRDIAGRLAAIEQEQQSYPKALPAEPFPGQT
ncbi:MAG TPA: hypothetical protein DCE26_05435 [Dehalococcoidia bacterium]|nr:hypothetical protein [Chloroflexota bacterium]MQF95201.1 hypothetical protein [SAR202 cluster bacterium]HAA95118.1 hypothetical protein [Dehalococcoidia bacterium]